jgi:hypothetical protein
VPSPSLFPGKIALKVEFGRPRRDRSPTPIRPTRVAAPRPTQPFRYLHDCSDCFRLERIAGWGLYPLESAAFSRRLGHSNMTAIPATYVEERASGVPVVSRLTLGQFGHAGLRAPGTMHARRRNQRKRSHRYGPRPCCTRRYRLPHNPETRQPTVKSSPTGYSPSRACKIDHRSGLSGARVIPFCTSVSP